MIYVIKPLLAATLDDEDIHKLNYPILGQIKYDGVFGWCRDGIMYSRSLKPIRNQALQNRIKTFGGLLNGFVGELIVEGKKLHEITSILNSEDKDAKDVTWKIFDKYNSIIPYARRHEVWPHRIIGQDGKLFAEKVASTVLNNPEEVFAFIDKIVCQDKHEGIILRNLNSTHKNGRSTVKEELLLRWKLFEEEEATIIEISPLKSNTNPATINELGHTERSSHKEGKEEQELLGSITVETRDKKIFKIGTGFSANQRKDFWNTNIIGKKVLFKHHATKIKIALRSCVFLKMID